MGVQRCSGMLPWQPILELKFLLAGFVWTIATRQLVMKGRLSGRPTEWRYCRYHAPKGRCHGKHFLAFYIWGAHWCHRVNTTEPPMCGGDAALSQITSATCYSLNCLFFIIVPCFVYILKNLIYDWWSAYLSVNYHSQYRAYNSCFKYVCSIICNSSGSNSAVVKVIVVLAIIIYVP